MALLARFFSPRRNQKKDSNVHQTLPNKISLRSSFRIEHDQVRILLFRECDWRGRKLLFDSSCVQKVPVNNLQVNGGGQSRRNSKDLIFEISNGFGYQYTRPSRDATSLGETIFGSVALSQKRSSIKVHSLHGPRRLMLSSVIYSPRPYRRRQISDRSLDDSYGSSFNSVSDYFSGSSSDAKSSFGDCQDVSLDQSLGNCDTAAYCPIHCSSLTPNCNSGASNCSNQSGGSLTSLRRRWLRSVTTSMNLDSLHNLIDIDSSQTTESNSSAESTQNSQTSTPKQRTKLGVAILINLHESQEKEMEEYLLQRIPLLVHLVARLQQNSERAYAHKDSFVQLMMDATADTAQALYDMLCGVCVEIPFWITLTSKQYEDNMTVQNELFSKFVKDLGYLLQTVDTKHTNFFMSTLLTAVLTHHLGWVPTVVPDKDSNEKQNQQDMLSALSQSHPYSPLWAQLSDLQGALGFPPKITKTVIVGQSDVLVSKILSVLTYFIRCGLVYSTPEERLENSGEDCLLEAIVSSKSDSPIDSSKIEGKIENTHDRDSELVKLPSSVLSKRKSLSNSYLLNELENNKNFSKTIHSDNNLMKNNCSNINLGNNEDNLKSSGFKKTSSSAALNKMVNYIEEETINESNFHPDVISDKVSKLCRVPKSAILYHMKIDENNIKEESDKDIPIAIKNSHTFTNFHSKIESEKQMASVDIKNHINRTLFQKDGKISLVNQGDLNLSRKENEQNVIFVLGENEELIGLKSNSNLQNNCKNAITPTICIDRCDEDATYNDDNQSFIISNNNNNNNNSGERSLKTLSKDDSIKTDDNRKNNKVLIIKPTTIEVEDCKKLSSIFNMPPQRCLSIPDEAMLVTDEIKEKRSRETVEIVRRWLSDSEIYTNKHKHCGVDFPDVKNTSNELVNGNSSEFDIGVDKNDRTNVEYCVELNLPSVSNDCDSVKRTNDDVNVNNCDNFEQDNDCFNCVNKNENSVIPSSDIHLPLPNSKMEDSETEIDLARTLIGGVSDHYIPSLVLQGIIQNSNVSRPPWESELRRDLQIEAHSPVLNQEISEAVCIVANIDTWEVQLVSSHTLVVEKILEGRSMGVRVGMSQLVANMLETVLTLCKLSVQPKHCISHIEAKLGEFWLKSITLSEMLLSKEFLDMDTLTSALDLDPNDVPLLLSVASIHSPQVTKKYGLSFQ